MSNIPNHFFKFIPPGLKFNISIPKSFLTNLDGWRCKKAILRRGRHKWPVHIGDEGVFGDGWSKFVVDNEVQEFDFIVFKHQGNMLFDFFIFDQSGCERRYPNLRDDVDQESLPETDSLHRHKRSKMVDMRKSTDSSSQRKDETRLNDDRFFVTIMTPCNIRDARLNVPMKFARSNGLTTKGLMHRQIVLVDQANRKWPATLIIKTYTIHLTNWRKLLIKNDLQVGDECMFKLVKGGEVPVFNFYNLRIKPQVEKESTSTTRYFISTLKPYSSEKLLLYLPVEFSTPNDLRRGEMILRDDKGRSWKVQLNKHGKNRFYLGHGFRDFWAANGLTEGGAYKFELVENMTDKPPIVNFSYLGKKAAKNDIRLQEASSSIKKVIGSTLVQKEKCKPLAMKDWTPSEIEDRSSYICQVKSYFIEKSMLYLPSKFVVKNGLLDKKEMIIKNDDERSWIVDIKHVRGYSYLGRRWKEFVVANGLKEGDHFKLELHNSGETIPVANFYVKKAH